MTVLMQRAGMYLKELRRMRGRTQSDLAEAIDVGRSTIDRLEGGGDEVGVGIVLRALYDLDASPWHYYDLATNPARTLNEIWHQRAVVQGIWAYITVLSERQGIPTSVLAEVTRMPVNTLAANSPPTVPEMALLLALIYLDAPLADLQPIVHATKEHAAIGRQQAEARSVFTAQLREGGPQDAPERHTLPWLDAVLKRLSSVLRYNHELPTVLRHELTRVEADLKRYRALLILAVGNIRAEP